MMKKSESPFVAYIIGPPESERYVIKDNRVDYPRFFAGTDDEEWTDDLRNSRKYFNIDDLRRPAGNTIPAAQLFLA
jgi:hypothetical protein